MTGDGCKDSMKPDVQSRMGAHFSRSRKMPWIMYARSRLLNHQEYSCVLSIRGEWVLRQVTKSQHPKRPSSRPKNLNSIFASRRLCSKAPLTLCFSPLHPSHACKQLLSGPSSSQQPAASSRPLPSSAPQVCLLTRFNRRVSSRGPATNSSRLIRPAPRRPSRFLSACNFHFCLLEAM